MRGRLLKWTPDLDPRLRRCGCHSVLIKGADHEEDETEDRCGAEGEDRLGALREQSRVTDLAQRYEVHVNQIYVWKQQPQDQAVQAFDAGAGRDGEAARELEVEKLPAKIGQLTVEWDFLSRRSGR